MRYLFLFINISTKPKAGVKLERLRNYKIQTHIITIIFTKDYLENETEVVLYENGNQGRKLQAEEDWAISGQVAQTPIAIGGSWLQPFISLLSRHFSPIHGLGWPFRLLS